MPFRKSITARKKRFYRRNLLFEKWLTEEMDRARTRESKAYHAYKKALSSLKRYPLRLESAKECRILEGFGSKLCDFLDEKLSRYAEELGMTSFDALSYGNNELSVNDPPSETHLCPKESAVSSLPSEDHRSPPELFANPVPCGPSSVDNNKTSPLSSTSNDYPLKFVYLDDHAEAVIRKDLALTKHFDSDDGTDQLTGYRIRCSYEELITSGIPYKIDWGAMGLLDSELTVAYIMDSNAPALSTSPIQTAQECTQSLPDDEDSQTINLRVSNGEVSRQQSLSKKRALSPTPSMTGRPFQFPRSLSEALPPPHLLGADHMTTTYFTHSQPSSPRSHPSVVGVVRPLVTGAHPKVMAIPSGKYELVLLVDVRETFGLNHVKQLLPPVLRELGVNCESRALPVGDFLWIARWVSPSGEQVEAVLDYIVERKRFDDLASSIIDGRFQEQKYRLKRTRISNAFYLIEECSSMRNQRIPYDTLLQAVSNGQLTDGFRILASRSPSDTVDLLSALTNTLREKCQHCELHIGPVDHSVSSDGDWVVRGHSWTDFVQMATKSPTPTIRDMFAKQLLQIHGCSGPKVASILDVYPTPLSLLRAYDSKPTDLAKADMLSSLKIANTSRRLGNTLSRNIYLVYNTM